MAVWHDLRITLLQNFNVKIQPKIAGLYTSIHRLVLIILEIQQCCDYSGYVSEHHKDN